MSTVRVLIGDVRERLAEIPDGSIDLILTSPPYLALRSYLPTDHSDKAKEIGSEATPAAFIDTMLSLTVEWRRVLAPHGSLCIELGDTYSGSGGSGGDYNADGLRFGQPKFAGSADKDRASPSAWPLAKSRTLIPELYRIGLAYAINPLTGQPSPAGRWRVRQVHYHCRPNPPVGALGDKFRPSVSEWVVACTSAKRWFDLTAVRGAPEDVRDQRRRTTNGLKNREGDGAEVMTANYTERVPSHPAGAPPLDHSWLDWGDWFPAAQRTPTTPYPGAHYATFGPAVIRPFVEAMCPMQVCTTCGEPRRRIVNVQKAAERNDTTRMKATGRINGLDHPPEIGWEMHRDTLGWSDCGHDTWRNGLTLDPFVGSGTTLEVATGCGRDALGIDLDERNHELIRERVGMFLEVSDA